MRISSLIDFPIESDKPRWEGRQVLRDLDGKPHLLVRLKITGTFFEHRALRPFIQVWTLRSRFAEIDPDGQSVRGYFDQPPHEDGVIEFGYGDDSMVGKNENQLTEEKVPYEIGVARYREIARGQILGDRVGMLKLLFHPDTRELLGVHVIGQGATELVHIGQMVLTFKGSIDVFIESTFNYPTLAECYRVAALDGYNKVASSVEATRAVD